MTLKLLPYLLLLAVSLDCWGQNKSDTVKSIDCRLNHTDWCSGAGLPSILFKENSTELVKEKAEDEVAYINDGYETLRDLSCIILNKKFVVEISAYADRKEKDALKLSIKRGEFVKAELIKMGVPDSVMIVKSYGSKSPFLLRQEGSGDVRKAITKRDKELVALHSRRVELSVLRILGHSQGDE